MDVCSEQTTFSNPGSGGVNPVCTTSMGQVQYATNITQTTDMLNITVERRVVSTGVALSPPTSLTTVSITSSGGLIVLSSNVTATPSRSDSSGNFDTLRLQFGEAQLVLMFMFGNQSTSVTVSVIPTPSLSMTPTPDDGTGVHITVNAQLNTLTYDVLEVIYTITRARTNVNSLDCYCGAIIPLPDGVKIQVLLLTINDVVRGTGTLIQKTQSFGISVFDLLVYVLVKVLMGKLIERPGCYSGLSFGELDLGWALRCRFKRLTKAIRNSQYRNVLTFIDAYSYLEEYLR